MGDKTLSKIAWENYSEENLLELEDLCSKYKDFLSKNKTERECVNYFINEAVKHNFKDLREVIKNREKLNKGDRVYYSKMDKTLILAVIGDESLENGFNIIGSHIDAPRIDIKQSPVYESDGLCYFDTHYYGGIKKYHWVARPMCLKGVVIKSNGDKVVINIGDDDNDPYLGFSDLLPHLWKDQAMKKGVDVIEGEQLNLLVGSRSLDGKKDKVKKLILSILSEKYGICEEDLISAELEVVPAGPAKDYGLDRSMVMGYGQDDRVCAFTSMKALFSKQEVDRTAVCLLVDKEEVGSIGATGMHSKFFENAVAELLDRMGEYSELKIRRTLENSVMLSSDVSAAYDPNYPSVNEKKNTAYFGKGIVFNKYTGSRGKGGCNDANAEYIAKLRGALEKHSVSFQTSELGKVDQGGGGTIAYIMAQYNMQVIDSGVAVLSMHAPWEITSKSDIYEAFCGYQAFLEEL